MNSLIKFINEFAKRGGIIVTLSTFASKFISAFLAIVVIRIVSKDEYANIAYILSFFAILVVFSGFGGNYSLLRFGSITKSISEKKYIYSYALRQGTKFASLFAFAVSIIFWYFTNDKQLFYLFIIMAIGLVTYYILEVFRSYFRIININKMFAKVNFYFAITSFVITVGLTFMFKSYGYIIALAVCPLIVYFIFKNSINNSETMRVNVHGKEFWTYGVHTSVSALANQVIFSIAPVLIAYLSNDKGNIASFKVATIIPFNVLLIPGILMQTDFTILARNSKSPHYLIDYYKNYLKLVGLISFLLFFISIYFGREIVLFVFGKEYIDTVLMYQIFMVATFFSYLFRNPLGNILLAVGKANWNGYNTYFFCVLYVVLSVFLYPYYEMYALVYSLAFVFIFSGFVSLIMFIYYIYSLKREIK